MFDKISKSYPVDRPENENMCYFHDSEKSEYSEISTFRVSVSQRLGKSVGSVISTYRYTDLLIY